MNMRELTFEKIADLYEEKLKNVTEFTFRKTGGDPEDVFYAHYSTKYSEYDIIAYSKLSFVVGEFENYLMMRFKEFENFSGETESVEETEPEQTEKHLIMVVYK
jgi:hypothetical protein